MTERTDAQCEQLNLLARAVYDAAYPEIDSKQAARELVPQIRDWLDDVDPTSVNITELAIEWLADEDEARINDELS